jgi:hypothetical protein
VLEATDVTIGLPVAHRVKGGNYIVYGIVKPAGESARALGEIVVYYDKNDPSKRYWRPMDDFCRSMYSLLYVTYAIPSPTPSITKCHELVQD